MRLRLFVAAAALLSASLAARADTYTVFNVTTNFGDCCGTLGGTITLDTTTDVFTSVDLLGTEWSDEDGGDGNVTLDAVSQGLTTNSKPLVEVFISNSATDPTAELTLYLPIGTLAGYDGGSVCVKKTSGCESNVTAYQYGFSNTDAASGTLTAVPNVAPTPEPSSIVLLGTGLLGVVGVVKRRFA